ncbi:TolC family protein [Burkholderia contaminans]|uniref:TolC family protein n=1 Tax=Burkholderia contaminans TaxID=488447 RepID=UPI002417FDA5|nr:TolC family protein [Burkholderia contaminans]WFN15386.1 TolC family protein [Burkholderia contaminans]
MKKIHLLRTLAGRLAFALTGIALAALLLAMPLTQAQIDPFRTRSGLEDVSPDLNRMARDTGACRPTSLQLPVSIYEAVSRALCSDPTVRESWANMLLNAAQVGVAKAAWLPTLDADGTRSHTTESQSVSGPTLPDEIGRVSDRYAELKLSWVLFDFGRRDSNLAYYKGLLELSRAGHTDTLQTVFEQAAAAFYAVWTAESTLDAANRAEANARRSYEIARHKHLAGAGTLNDELQAKAAWQEAIYTRVTATGTLKAAQGTLCLRMGIPVETEVTVDVDAGAQPDVNFTSSISDLLALAESVNPKLREAQAQVEADEANAKLALRREMPTISLTGSLSNDKSLGAFPRDTRTYSKYVGIEVSIPIFAGFGDEYHRQASEAQVDMDRANLRKTELEVASAVWRNYQDVVTKTANLQVADSTQESAQEAYDVASKRYSAGVGPLLDVLNAQTTLATAQRQVVQSQADWRVSRLVLAFSIGTLDGQRWTPHAEAP